MTAARQTSNEHSVGGRLRLMTVNELDAEQRELRSRVLATRVAIGQRSGYRAALDDGRLVGPFNAFLRAPRIGERQLDWADAVSAAGLAPTARETAILVVATQWQAEYVLYAHRAAARAAGLRDEVIDDITGGGNPTGLDRVAQLAHDVAFAIVRDHDVPDDLYRDFLSVYGEARAVALLALIGQYLATCTVTTCFRVPAPTSDPVWTRPTNQPISPGGTPCHSSTSTCTTA